MPFYLVIRERCYATKLRIRYAQLSVLVRLVSAMRHCARSIIKGKVISFSLHT
jgi:hypothetical protein